LCSLHVAWMEDLSDLTCTPVPLCKGANCPPPTSQSVGMLQFRGGLALRSSVGGFGGWSGLRLSQEAGVVAISDEGWVMSATLLYEDGWLTGVSNGRIAPLLNLDGSVLEHGNKAWSDAESIAVSNHTSPLQGDVFISFEGNHRVWRYPPAPSSSSILGVPTVPKNLDPEEIPTHICQPNGGVEAMEFLHDGRLLLLCEDPVQDIFLHADKEMVPGWIYSFDGNFSLVYYQVEDGLRPVAMARLPGKEDLLVLERFWSAATGNILRIRHLSPEVLLLAQQNPSECVMVGSLLAELNNSQHNVDNFEGLAVLPGAGNPGQIEFAIVSDDNYNPYQRTLLFSFLLDVSRLPPASCTRVNTLSSDTDVNQLGKKDGSAAQALALAMSIVFIVLGSLYGLWSFVLKKRLQRRNFELAPLWSHLDEEEHKPRTNTEEN